ncbi:MAG: hypothetical protein JO282_15855 [Alphaproteobacteria bacterium]|nr:hypothetical protein [Alphaproteobacteria bacterium]
MSNDISARPPGRVRGRPFKKGRSRNPGGRRPGSRNKATLAAAVLLADESEALTRKAVEMALAGDPTAMRLCMERVLPPCRERTVKFSLPPIESDPARETCGPSTRDVSLAMNAVTSALAEGEITPCEAERIAGVVDTFVRAIEATKKASSGLNLLQILTAGNYDDDNSEDDSGGVDYEGAGDYEEN